MDRIEPPIEYACDANSRIGQQMYLNDEYADFFFIFETDGQIERVPAHKAILATASEVFKIMFNGSWSEVNEVPIVDARCGAFKEFLQFFYLSKVKLTAQNIDHVINLGKKYDITECLRICLEYFKNNLTYENICSAYGIAIFYEQEDLRKLCETMISVNTKALFKSANFLKCERKMLAQILTIDAFSCSEVELFEAVINWVRTAGQQEDLTRELLESELGETFYQIRFGTMAPEEFSALIPSYGALFTNEESQEIFQMCSLIEYEPKFFTSKRRNRYGFKDDVSLECFRLLSEYGSNVPYLIKNTETAIFSTNQPFLLKSIYCAKLTFYVNENYVDNGETILPSKVSIIEKPHLSNENDANTLEILMANLYMTHTTCIDLPRPILVRPGYFYAIRMEQTAPANCCSAVLLKSEIPIGFDTVVKFHNDPVVDSDKTASRGLVSGLVCYPIFT